MDKTRYQVFVSSTYADLKDERRAVIQALIQIDCIPAGMELFPATDEDQLQFIKRVIDDCDYYLLIIGGRYGSTTAEGISYTEREYDYAVGLGLKVIALIHENPDEIPLGKSEKEPLLREKLGEFRRKVMTGRMVKLWRSSTELPSLVTMSLLHTIRMFPAVGWIRANKAASEDLLAEINELRKQNTRLQAATGEFSPRIENLAGLKDEIELFGTCQSRSDYHRQVAWTVTLSWGEIFGLISPYMLQHPTDDFVKSKLAGDAFAKSSHPENYRYPHLDDQIFRTVAVQLQALGLVNLKYTKATNGNMALFWTNTPSGERLMMKLRTVKSVKTPKEGKAK